MLACSDASQCGHQGPLISQEGHFCSICFVSFRVLRHSALTFCFLTEIPPFSWVSACLATEHMPPIRYATVAVSLQGIRLGMFNHQTVWCFPTRSPRMNLDSYAATPQISPNDENAPEEIRKPPGMSWCLACFRCALGILWPVPVLKAINFLLQIGAFAYANDQRPSLFRPKPDQVAPVL